MPTYEYVCSDCHNEWEEVQKISEPALDVCPKCGKSTAKRQISGGNFILKGGGWYADLYSSTPKAKSGGEGKSDGAGGAAPAKSDGGSGASAPAAASGGSAGSGASGSSGSSGAGSSGGSSGSSSGSSGSASSGGGSGGGTPASK